MSATDVLLVGGGIAGLATAWWLAAPTRGTPPRVVLLERDPRLAAQASAQNAAILRTLDPDPALTRIGERGASFLAAPPPGFADGPLIDRAGLVLVSDPGAPTSELERWLVHSRAHYEALSPAALARAVPAFRVPDGARAWCFPDEGRLDVAGLCAAFARGARARGVDIRTGAAGDVRALLRVDGRVCGVELADGSTLEARTVVVAAGGWAQRLGKSAGSRLAFQPTRRHLLVTVPDPAVDPRWPVLWRHGESFYCRPESAGMLVCAFDQTDVDDPDALACDPAQRAAIERKTAHNLPTLAGGLAGGRAAHWWCGMRTFAPDGRFTIGFDPDVPGLFWVAGLGGHGMTAGAEVGRLAAALLRGDSPAEAEPFRPARAYAE